MEIHVIPTDVSVGGSEDSYGLQRSAGPSREVSAAVMEPSATRVTEAGSACEEDGSRQPDAEEDKSSLAKEAASYEDGGKEDGKEERGEGKQEVKGNMGLSVVSLDSQQLEEVTAQPLGSPTAVSRQRTPTSPTGQQRLSTGSTATGMRALQQQLVMDFELQGTVASARQSATASASSKHRGGSGRSGSPSATVRSENGSPSPLGSPAAAAATSSQPMRTLEQLSRVPGNTGSAFYCSMRISERVGLASNKVLSPESIPPASRPNAGKQRRQRAAKLSRDGPPRKQYKLPPRPPTPDTTQLDGFKLLEAACTEEPEEVETVVLEGQGISSVEERDLAYFPNLKELQLSDNRLESLAPFAHFPSLQTLGLNANRLRSVPPLPADAFMSLRALELSYNQLPGDAVLGRDSPISQMPGLRELSASGNKMGRLPKLLGPFASLEVLHLDRNQLGIQSLRSLGALQRLRRLFVSHNFITDIPAHLIASEAFPQLEYLDLSFNRVKSEVSLSVLDALPMLQQVQLTGNDVTARLNQPVRLKGWRAVQEANLRAQKLLTKPPRLVKPGAGTSLAEARHTVQDDATKIQHPLASVPAIRFDQIPHSRIVAAFERVQDSISAFAALHPIAEDAEAERAGALSAAGADASQSGKQSGGDGVNVQAQSTIYIPERASSSGEGMQDGDLDADASTADGEGDPSERLALALGIDPHLLAHRSGRYTGEGTRVLHMLKFALAHPLAHDEEGALNPKVVHYQQLTHAARSKRRQKILRPLDERVAALPVPPTLAEEKRVVVEDALKQMKERLEVGMRCSDEDGRGCDEDLVRGAKLIQQEMLLAVEKTIQKQLEATNMHRTAELDPLLRLESDADALTSSAEPAAEAESESRGTSPRGGGAAAADAPVARSPELASTSSGKTMLRSGAGAGSVRRSVSFSPIPPTVGPAPSPGSAAAADGSGPADAEGSREPQPAPAASPSLVRRAGLNLQKQLSAQAASLKETAAV